MAAIGEQFDANKHHADDFSALPEGEYLVEIKKSDVKLDPTETKKYVFLNTTVIQGEFAGRLMSFFLYIRHPNPIAVDIGSKHFGTVCCAVGVPEPKDTRQLHDIPFILKVGIKPASGQYSAKNKIIIAKPYGGDGVNKTQPTSLPENTGRKNQNSVGKTTPPWVTNGQKQENHDDEIPPGNQSFDETESCDIPY